MPSESNHNTTYKATLQLLSLDLVDSFFKDYKKYVDILLDPDAMKFQYDEAVHGYHDVVTFLRGVDDDFIITVTLYTSERRFQQRLIRDLWRLYLPRRLRRMKLLGHKFECMPISSWSVAPRSRWESCDGIQQVIDDEDRVFVPT